MATNDVTLAKTISLDAVKFIQDIAEGILEDYDRAYPRNNKFNDDAAHASLSSIETRAQMLKSFLNNLKECK